ncbi:hypothetical protein RJ640_009674 [Escallonia rubra]|uniref:E3 ubiquitin-protein ligase LIN-1 n=1 Tax=Escallonia rubra TaxID=112253 RepID=A0AA88QY17_9ASTE|nr:hypothetical protein RJ640_009674 [Escallonia rubra]
MASLQELLAEEGFKGEKFLKSQKKVKFRDRTAPDASITLPIYICRDKKSFDFSKNITKKAFSRNGSSVYSSKRGDTESGRLNSRTIAEPAIDEVAIRAVISILSGYIGQYLRDESFRGNIKEKCNSCFVRKKEDCDNGILANIQLGIQSIEKLVENPGAKQDLKVKSVRNAIGLLSVVASLNSKSSKDGSTCGTPNSDLSACAQLYLSVVYKLEKNDRISARHLLQVFCDSPFLARTHLLPELWEHFFLPHLLHLKIWYSKEVEFVLNSGYGDKEMKIVALTKVYNDQIDMGTIKFALYYKEWLKTGVQAPPLPSVPLPSRSRRRSSDSFSSNSSIKKSLYRAVFGPTLEHRSMDLDDQNGSSINTQDFEEGERLCFDEDNGKQCSFSGSKRAAQRRSSSQSCRKSEDALWPETQKSDYFRFLICRSEAIENVDLMACNGSFKKTVNASNNSSGDLGRAITTISSSDSLSNCETAIRVITKAWLDSHGDPAVEAKLAKASIIEGILEVLFASNDDEVLELAISLLAELVTRKESNGQIILKSDPLLEIFMRLLRSNTLFLKAAALLYLLKPKAKQMISTEWVPLVLRVLEFGDQLQTLFTVRFLPQVAAYYLLDQLLYGFDEDKNWENAKQVVSLGGLSLLVKRIEIGDICEKSKAAAVINSCIQADGRCRHYLANNLNRNSVLELLVLGKEKEYHGHAFSLLTELFCLHRTQRTELLNGLMSGWGSLNTMHILLVYLQRARPEERPIAAAMLLQLDLMGDPLKSSVYREEVVEAIIAALDCQIYDEKVQEQSARALLILGGRFSYSGEPAAEKWLLKQAGFAESSGDSCHRRNNDINDFMHLNEEDDAIEAWQRKIAIVLLCSGKKKLLEVLSDSIANGIPCLARASLVTVSWMSNFFHSVGDQSLLSVACSILIPQLMESLNHNKDMEERVIASYSLLNLAKSSDSLSANLLFNKELMGQLQNLSHVTWTANAVISITRSSSRQRSTK